MPPYRCSLNEGEAIRICTIRDIRQGLIPKSSTGARRTSKVISQVLTRQTKNANVYGHMARCTIAIMKSSVQEPADYTPSMVHMLAASLREYLPSFNESTTTPELAVSLLYGRKKKACHHLMSICMVAKKRHTIV